LLTIAALKSRHKIQWSIMLSAIIRLFLLGHSQTTEYAKPNFLYFDLG